MKKLFTILFLTIILFAGCAKIEDLSIRDNNFNKTEIKFNTTTTSKAIVDTTAMVDHFGIYGYVVPGNYSINGGYLMKNGEYDEKGDAVNGPYYWPKSDNYTGIDFIFTAYSQFESAPTWENDTLKLVVPTLTQALIDNEDDFDDILWAQTKYNYHQNSLSDHERVDLEFKHALSWLQFRGEVINPNIKWVKVKQISFGEYRDSIPGTPGQEYIAPYKDTTDTWFRLKTNTLVNGTSNRSDDILPELLAEIRSYYSIDGNDAGDYSAVLNAKGAITGTHQLRKSDKLIPAEYKKTVDIKGTNFDFFDGYKYLKDHGWEMNMSAGSKPAVADYILINLHKNDYGVWTAQTFNWGYTDAAPQYTIVENPGQEYIAPTPAIPAHGSVGLYVDGTLCLHTKDILTTTPLAVYGTQKDTTLNYVKTQVDTIKTDDHIILGNSLVVPQPVPEKITVVFDICIVNPTGDEVVFTDRKITRTINTGKDTDEDATYVASWGASNKYIYNFRFNGDLVDFSTTITGWALSGTDYHVWDY